MRRQPNRRPNRPLWMRVIKWALLSAVVCALLGVIAVAAIFWYYSRDLPDLNTIGDYRPKQATHVFSAEGELIDIWTDDELIYRTVVPLEAIPQVMRDAVIAAEDADFYSHGGLDLPGVLRAIYVNVRSGQLSQGFSTITQQVVKNLILTPERTIRRKVQEVLLAFRLEERLSKDEILALYLNASYFGSNRYGVEEAARYYFGQSVSDLELPEAALLAGLLPAPERFNPVRHPERALERRGFVLEQMWAKGFIEESAYRTAVEAPLTLAENPFPHLGEAPYFAQAVRRQLIEALGADAALTGGLQVHTTVRLDHQEAAEESLRLALQAYDERHDAFRPVRHLEGEETDAFRRQVDPALGVREGRSYEVVVLEVRERSLLVGLGWLEIELALEPYRRINPNGSPLEELYAVGDVLRCVAGATAAEDVLAEAPESAGLRLVASAEAGFVSIDPRTREVLALVGGYDFEVSSFDRATQSRRQCGSAFKPFIYGAALAYRLVTPATLVRDEPAPFPLPGGRIWNPQNDDGEYLGPVPLRTALARSRNVVSVRLLAEMGLEREREFARNAGIVTELTDNLTTALGSTEMPVLELVNGYATIAAVGEVHAPILVSRVVDSTGQVVMESRYQPTMGVDPAVAYVLTDLMTSVIERGTGRAARPIGRPAAGKTGTTNEARDAWFVGFVPQLVAGGWVGRDDYQPLGRGEYGGRAALPMWLHYMQAMLEDVPVEDFQRPERGVVVRRVDPSTGLLASPDAEDAVDEIFIQGTEPTRYAPAQSLGSSDEALLRPGESDSEVEPQRRYDDF